MPPRGVELLPSKTADTPAVTCDGPLMMAAGGATTVGVGVGALMATCCTATPVRPASSLTTSVTSKAPAAV